MTACGNSCSFNSARSRVIYGFKLTKQPLAACSGIQLVSPRTTSGGIPLAIMVVSLATPPLTSFIRVTFTCGFFSMCLSAISCQNGSSPPHCA